MRNALRDGVRAYWVFTKEHPWDSLGWTVGIFIVSEFLKNLMGKIFFDPILDPLLRWLGLGQAWSLALSPLISTLLIALVLTALVWVTWWRSRYGALIAAGLTKQKTILLGDAASVAYDATQASHVINYGDAGGRLAYHASAICIDAERSLLTIYGIRPPGTQLRPIPSKWFKGGALGMTKDYRAILWRGDEARIEWDQLSITRADLKAHIARQKTIVDGYIKEGGKLGDG